LNKILISVPQSPFLAVQASFWPLIVSLLLFSVMSNMVLYLNLKLSLGFVVAPTFLLVLCAFL